MLEYVIVIVFPLMSLQRPGVLAYLGVGIIFIDAFVDCLVVLGIDHESAPFDYSQTFSD